jgi:ubiquinone/menaquinone biosynthesis C-methylase UbiE
MSAWAILFGAAALIVLISAIWRWASLPCPFWLVPLLENPYFNTVAGAELVLDRAGVRPGMQVLDVGCGPGRVTLPAARRVGPSGRVVALDLQAGMIRKLQSRLRAEDIGNVELIHAGIGEGRLPPKQCDVALMVTMLGEVRDKSAALGELYGALRPGGVASVTEALPDPHYISARRVRQLFTEAGFRELSILRGRLAYTLNFTAPISPEDIAERELFSRG